MRFQTNLENFWSSPRDGATPRHGRILFFYPAQAKVSDLTTQILVNQDIVRCQVAMDKWGLERMKVVHSNSGLLSHVQPLHPGQFVALEESKE